MQGGFFHGGQDQQDISCKGICKQRSCEVFVEHGDSSGKMASLLDDRDAASAAADHEAAVLDHGADGVELDDFLWLWRGNDTPEAAAGMASADVNTLKATLTAPPKAPAGAPAGDDKKKVTALLLQDILVLATGAQRIGMPAPARNAGEQNMYNSVTLMLARKEAQMLTLCLTQGQINLILRKAGETGKVADVPPVSCADLPDFLAR